MDSPALSPIGRLLFVQDVVESLRARQRTFAYATKHSELFIGPAHELETVFILGAPRTGSTLFHRLLALDDRSISPHMIEMIRWDGMLPPFDPKVEKERFDSLKKSLVADASIFPDYGRQVQASHPSSLDEPEEETLIFGIAPVFIRGLIIVAYCNAVKNGNSGA